VLLPVADGVDHLVRYGHSDPRVARFAQGPLRNFELFMREPEPFAYYRPYGAATITVHPVDLRAGRQLLNETFSRCMREHNPALLIPPLALYLLAAGQKYGWEMCLERLVKCKGFLYDYTFDGFYPGAENCEAFAVWHLQSLRKKQRWYRPMTQEIARAEALVSLITELRYCLSVLANQPILAPTGEYQPKAQPRTYADATAERANELSQLPNYTARVRFLSSGEHVLKTRPLPPGLSGEALAERIRRIKRQMWEQGYTRY
jgi:hypothetical protein